MVKWDCSRFFYKKNITLYKKASLILHLRHHQIWFINLKCHDTLTSLNREGLPASVAKCDDTYVLSFDLHHGEIPEPRIDPEGVINQQKGCLPSKIYSVPMPTTSVIQNVVANFIPRFFFCHHFCYYKLPTRITDPLCLGPQKN